MRLFLSLLLAFLVAACGDGPTEPKAADISGSWSYTFQMTDSQAGVSCSGSGTLSLTQSGSNFSGNGTEDGTCSDAGGSFSYSGSGPITGGQIDGNSVSLETAECSYSGTISGSPPNRMSGPLSCSFTTSGYTFDFSGNWVASR